MDKQTFYTLDINNQVGLAGMSQPINLDPESMRAAAEQASELLKSLGNRHRLMILCVLAQGEQSVGQLAETLGVRDSTVSQHLALLRRDRIIVGRRDGQMVWYRIESDVARDVMAVLYAHFCKV